MLVVDTHCDLPRGEYAVREGGDRWRVVPQSQVVALWQSGVNVYWICGDRRAQLSFPAPVDRAQLTLF